MALPAAGVYEVRSGGSDTNGGGFVFGGTGTDWSQQDAAQYSVTDAVTNGTSTITSATANFGTDVVDNYLRISGGTAPITANDYRIVSRTNSTTIVVDRSTGLTAGTGATLKIGGAKATLQAALATWVAGNRIWVKKTSGYTVGTGIAQAAVNTLPNAVPNMIMGYDATRGDNPIGANRPALTASAAIDLLTITDVNILVSNLILDCASTGNRAFGFNGSNIERGARLVNVSARNFKTNGFLIGLAGALACDATGGNSGCTAGFNGGRFLHSCIASDNANHGFLCGGDSVHINCIADSNTGASTDGFNHEAGSGALSAAQMFNCIAYNNGRDGIRFTNTYEALWVLNCILEANGGYGLRSGYFYAVAAQHYNYNAFYNNTSGARLNLIAGANDFALSGSAFVDAANGDFRLNNTASQGALLRAAGFPGVFPGGLTTGYLDVGAAQHQDAGGSSGGGLKLAGGGGLAG